MAPRTTSSRFSSRKAGLTCCFIFIVWIPVLHASILRVPKDYPTIQAGIDAAGRGDTVLVAPGNYFEQVLILKKITLASRFLETGDSSDISQTIIDGGGDHNLTIWIKSGGNGATISGLTITHGLDGIKCQAMATIVDNHIIDNGDGIDYSSVSGGLCARNVIENSIAEGIDIDDKVAITIEDNILRNNGSDGIEIQLEDYRGDILTYRIRQNEIYGNRFDGIQLVENNGISDREFYIERNLIHHNHSSGVGMMENGDLRHSFLVADLQDRVYIFNNTLASNKYGVTGGDNVVALNNLAIRNKMAAMKSIDGTSIVAYCLFWANGVDFDHCNVDSKTFVSTNPLLDSDLHYLNGSPGIDRGVAFFVWQGDTVLDLQADDYAGSAPDIGADEYVPISGIANVTAQGSADFVLLPNYPNPFNAQTKITFILPSAVNVRLEIFNSRGQKIRILVNAHRLPGIYAVSWDGRDEADTDVASGTYFSHLRAGRFNAVRKLSLIR